MAKKHIPAYIGFGLGLSGITGNTIEVMVSAEGIGAMRPGLILVSLVLIFLSLTGIMHRIATRR